MCTHSHRHMKDSVTDSLTNLQSHTQTHSHTCTVSTPSLSPLQLWHTGEETANGLPHHGVLAHEDDTPAAHGPANVLHLTGAHIVRSDHKHTVVRLKGLLQREREQCRISKQNNNKHQHTTNTQG